MKKHLAVLMKDGYKSFHPYAYHPEVTEVTTNFTPRNGKYSNTLDKSQVVHFGTTFVLIEVLQDMFNEQFFNIPKDQMVAEYKRVLEAYLGHEVSTKIFEELHDLGYLPIEVRSLPEGSLVPYQVPVLTIRNTHPDFAWLPNMLETILSCYLWTLMTSSTTAFNFLKKTKESFKLSGGNEGLTPFMCHDFSFRGDFGLEAATLAGLGHLSCFAGTDTLPAVLAAEDYYGVTVGEDLVGASVDATEHSVTCSWIEEGEEAFVDYLMSTASKKGILSVVADTWDFWNFVTVLLPKLKDKILAREGKLVIRPDSGDPVEILCGKHFHEIEEEVESLDEWKELVAEVMDEKFREELDAEAPTSSDTQLFTSKFGSFTVTYTPDLNRHDKQYYYVDNYGSTVSKCEFVPLDPSPEDKGLIQVLWEEFGGTVNEKGFKQLDEHIGAIYGDAITLARQKEIHERLMAKGFVPDVVLGVGSYSYQYVTRDTHGSAVKATNVIKSGKDLPISKEPKTDLSKKSAKGLLTVTKDSNDQYSCQNNSPREVFLSDENELKAVYLDGKILKKENLLDIRQRLYELA